jgi:hypothetical protein
MRGYPALESLAESSLLGLLLESNILLNPQRMVGVPTRSVYFNMKDKPNRGAFERPISCSNARFRLNVAGGQCDFRRRRVAKMYSGDQLRLALEALDQEKGSIMAQDWGRCLAQMHTSQVPEGVIQLSPESGMRYWSNPERYENVFDQVDAEDPFWTSNMRDQINQFLTDRRDSLEGIRPGIMKADSDTRDFLVAVEPTVHISGMLDWERVNYGYVLYDCLVAYIRLVIGGREELWSHFCEGYETETGRPLLQTADVEYILMVRGLLPALRGLPRAKKIISLLIEEQQIPFKKRI